MSFYNHVGSHSSSCLDYTIIESNYWILYLQLLRRRVRITRTSTLDCLLWSADIRRVSLLNARSLVLDR